MPSSIISPRSKSPLLLRTFSSILLEKYNPNGEQTSSLPSSKTISLVYPLLHSINTEFSSYIQSSKARKRSQELAFRYLLYSVSVKTPPLNTRPNQEKLEGQKRGPRVSQRESIRSIYIILIVRNTISGNLRFIPEQNL